MAGVAWSQDRGIKRVEVRVDGGPWQEATLADQDNIDTWRQWMYEWDADVRQRTPSRSARPTTPATRRPTSACPIAPNGSTGWHSVNVTGT